MRGQFIKRFSQNLVNPDQQGGITIVDQHDANDEELEEPDPAQTMPMTVLKAMQRIRMDEFDFPNPRDRAQLQQKKNLLDVVVGFAQRCGIDI